MSSIVTYLVKFGCNPSISHFLWAAGILWPVLSATNRERARSFHRPQLTEHCTDPVCALQSHAYGFQRGPGGRFSGLQPPSECMPC